MAKDHSAQDVSELLDADPTTGAAQTASLELDDGDTAWNPASTKGVINGPAVVVYVRYRDGGVTARVIGS